MPKVLSHRADQWRSQNLDGTEIGRLFEAARREARGGTQDGDSEGGLDVGRLVAELLVESERTWSTMMQLTNMVETLQWKVANLERRLGR